MIFPSMHDGRRRLRLISKDQVQSVSTILFQTEQLRVQCSVSLFDREANELTYFSVFQGNMGRYVSINPKTSLRIRYAPKIGSVEYVVNHSNSSSGYSRQSQVYVTPNYLYGLNRAIKEFWKRFNRDDLYVYNEEGYPVAMNANPDDIVTLDMGYGQALRLSPSIYYPPDRKMGEVQESYPGVAINVNLESQEANLNLEQFTNFMEVLERFDFNQMGMQLLQNYLLLKNEPQLTMANYTKDGQRIQKPIAREVTSNALMQFRSSKNEDGEYVSQNPIVQTPTTLDELN